MLVTRKYTTSHSNKFQNIQPEAQTLISCLVALGVESPRVGATKAACLLAGLGISARVGSPKKAAVGV